MDSQQSLSLRGSSVLAALSRSGWWLFVHLGLRLALFLLIVVFEEEEGEHAEDAADADTDGFTLQGGTRKRRKIYSREMGLKLYNVLFKFVLFHSGLFRVSIKSSFSYIYQQIRTFHPHFIFLSPFLTETEQTRATRRD